VSDGFVGGRCGGAAPAQGRAEGPTAQSNRNVERAIAIASFVQGVAHWLGMGRYGSAAIWPVD